jgi:hypothetical protein
MEIGKMANVEKSISEVVDVLLHLVRTHVRWNQDLSHDEAVAKLEAARLHAVGADAEKVTGDVQSAVVDVTAGNVVGAVGDAENAVQDGKTLVSDAVSMGKSSE